LKIYRLLRNILVFTCFLSLSNACSDIDVQNTGCESCPDRCLKNTSGVGTCVACLTDIHCQSPAGPTKECTLDFKCVCGTDQDCSTGQHCDETGGCVECVTDSHCTSPTAPYCINAECQACKVGQQRDCTLDDDKLCAIGKQTCEKNGSWSTCAITKQDACSPQEYCKDGTCICQSSFTKCGDECVLLFADAKHCGACGNACKEGALCASGTCVDKCPSDTPTICGNACINVTKNPNHCGGCNNACKEGQQCLGGQCVCPPHSVLCEGRCVDTRSSRMHCGGCGKACKNGQSCANGACLLRCPASTPEGCFGSCVNTQNNPSHCGACGKACLAGQQCVKGSCQCPSNRLKCNGQCVNTDIHIGHCGACDNKCKDGQSCAEGSCRAYCPSATPTVCFGGCVDTNTNSQHCGACGKACPGMQYCEKGQCVCPKGTALCGNACVDITSNRLNCGGCGKVCANNELCANNQCVRTCPRQTPTQCNGACVDTQSDTRNCGACGVQCPGNQACHLGKCQCPNSLQLCGTQCVDTSFSQDHCGQCGTKCLPYQGCIQGICIHTGCPGPTPLTCNKECVDPKSNTTHCGICNNSCTTNENCLAGGCLAKGCTQDKPKKCGGICTDVLTDTSHCGGCDKSCKEGELCIRGQCLIKCPSDKPLRCGNQCVDPNTDNLHCSQCGNVCPTGYGCQAGTCQKLNCPVGQQLCNQTCTDLRTNTQHCGACGNTCPTGQSCCNGTCGIPNPGAIEECNDKDDDCDGQIDEGYPNKGTSCSVGVGACAATGIYVCASDKKQTECSAIQSDPSTEICDGIDNDCDGTVDEGFQASQCKASELHVVGVYEGSPPYTPAPNGNGNRFGVVNVSIQRTNKAFILALVSYEPIKWALNVSSGVVIKKVILGGYYSHTVLGLPQGIPIEHKTYYSAQGQSGVKGYITSSHTQSGQDYTKLESQLLSLTGLSITSFQGKYQGSQFTIK